MRSVEPIQIHSLERKDIDVLYRLICELAVYERKDLSKLPLTKESLFRFGFGPTRYFYADLAEVGGEAVGYTIYFYTFSAYLGLPVLYLEDLYVQPQYQRRGIGSLLLKRLACLAREHNCCRLEAHVFDWNQGAISFYEKLGAELKRDLLLIRAHGEAIKQLAIEIADDPLF